MVSVEEDLMLAIWGPMLLAALPLCLGLLWLIGGEFTEFDGLIARRTRR
jgi:hypothetical protein